MVMIFKNKRVEETDRQHRLEIPHGCLGESGKRLQVRDEGNIGNDPMEFVYKKEARKSYLAGEHWIDFVRSKGIEAGDLISLSKEKGDDYYKIKVIKKI